jgi:hypothetical protein
MNQGRAAAPGGTPGGRPPFAFRLKQRARRLPARTHNG